MKRRKKREAEKEIGREFASFTGEWSLVSWKVLGSGVFRSNVWEVSAGTEMLPGRDGGFGWFLKTVEYLFGVRSETLTAI